MPHIGEVQANLAKLTKTVSSGGGGSASWGGINGTLSDQTDLQTALNGKSPLVHGHSGIPVVGQIVVTVPALAYEHEQTVSAVGITSGMKIIASIGPHGDADENHETMIDVTALAAEAGADQITLRAGFGEPTSGAIRINYMAA